MEELLRRINETFDNSINTSSDEVALQLQILKGNINTLFNEAMVQASIPKTLEEPVITEAINKKNILIVDDSNIIRNYLQKCCGDNFNVTLSESGADAINLLAANKYDLILLDLMMPGIDGFGVLEYLKTNNIFVPIIIISGDTTKETIDRAFSYNVVDMIEKPFSEKTILDKINRILG